MKPSATNKHVKQRDADKMLRRIQVDVVSQQQTNIPKPPWIRVKLPVDDRVVKLKKQLRKSNLVTVCEEASCPNIHECFGHGTATFMIMGDRCTRRCSFCDVAHGRPEALDPEEPHNLAQTIQDMRLSYVVITSVDRDDLRDGGASHFVSCIQATRALNPDIAIEILVPDFRGRGRMDVALEHLAQEPPDVFNHNLETVPHLYRTARPGSDYQWSLTLLKRFKDLFPHLPTKSGLMLGLGERDEELIETLHDLRAHKVDMLTLGQYLQPSPHHLPVHRYVSPERFDELGQIAKDMGFTHVASGPLVRSSYHADLQAKGEQVS